ncbi:hypothetical protein BDR04DRAFT_1163363 [Suillus decipiens]|nr:hypothetical protein BDR04DRAFT_1163363 [Suillus decipiens]
MAKCTTSNDDEPTPKRIKVNESNCQTAPSPWEDVNAWCILEQFLTTNITYPQTEDAFLSYLGDQYTPDDWKDARAALFSGDGDDALALSNLHALMAANIPQGSSVMMSVAKDSPVATSASRQGGRSCSRSNFKRFIDNEAGESEDDEEEYDDDDEGVVGDRLSVQSHSITHLPGPSAKHTLAAVIDDIFKKYEMTSKRSSEQHLPYRAAWSPGIVINRMYLLIVHRTAAHYIAKHLQTRGFPVTVSAWLPGQLYMVSDSLRTIAASLPPSHSLSVKEYLVIPEEERQAVEHSSTKLPNPSWVRIKHGKYKGNIGYVFDPDQSNLFVTVLIPPREFPYDMPQGSVALLNRSRLPNDSVVSEILCDRDVVGHSYKEQCYYGGLLLKNCHHHLVELVASPHTDEIRLHVQSGWDKAFMKKTIAAFSMQFLHKGNAVRVIKGEVCSEISMVISTHHAAGTQDVVTRSYLKSPPRRFVTPPPDPVPSGSSSSISADPSLLSSTWTNWNASLVDTNITHDPLLIVASSSDPWSFNADDMQDTSSASTTQVPDNGLLPCIQSLAEVHGREAPQAICNNGLS